MSKSKVVALVLSGLVASAGAAGAAPVLQLQAHGVQVYACRPAAAGYGWKLVGPDATLNDAAGAPAGRHFAGPSWQATDGSSVTGAVVAAGSTAGAVPWLVLRAASHAGAGRFANVAYITRTATVGGVAPAGGCDAGHAGAIARVPYRGTYTFFPAP